MPKAIRYQHNGQYLRNTMFWTQGEFIGAFHADPVLAAEEEALTIASHAHDFAVAFGIPADEITHEVVAWDGRDETLPFASDNSAPVVRLPVAPEEPAPPTLEEKVDALLAASPAIAQALGITLKG
jgi:hypothetical protein